MSESIEAALGFTTQNFGRKVRRSFGDLLRPDAAGLGHVPLEQPLQVLHVRLHRLRVRCG